mmetsp:Transcript_29975/g.88913  ORF Transcript_29975/g.88913 Transcript_29975/m.88913 type:complete len:244 (-) Transcript_29975:1317-2048(-)
MLCRRQRSSPTAAWSPRKRARWTTSSGSRAAPATGARCGPQCLAAAVHHALCSSDSCCSVSRRAAPALPAPCTSTTCGSAGCAKPTLARFSGRTSLRQSRACARRLRGLRVKACNMWCALWRALRHVHPLVKLRGTQLAAATAAAEMLAPEVAGAQLMAQTRTPTFGWCFVMRGSRCRTSCTKRSLWAGLALSKVSTAWMAATTGMRTMRMPTLTAAAATPASVAATVGAASRCLAPADGGVR